MKVRFLSHFGADAPLLTDAGQDEGGRPAGIAAAPVPILPLGTGRGCPLICMVEEVSGLPKYWGDRSCGSCSGGSAFELCFPQLPDAAGCQGDRASPEPGVGGVHGRHEPSPPLLIKASKSARGARSIATSSTVTTPALE